MTIYSDGGVFHGMCDAGYKKEDRLTYIETLKKFIKDEGLKKNIKIIDTENLKNTLDELGATLENKVKTDKDTLTLYNGQKYFWQEEARSLHPDYAKKRISKVASKMAYDITRYSGALSKYIDQQHQNSLRFSCHPKSIDSNKIGIYFNQYRDHATPWHNTAIKINGNTINSKEDWALMKNKDIKKFGNLVTLKNDNNGNPSHYEITPQANKTILYICTKKI